MIAVLALLLAQAVPAQAEGEAQTDAPARERIPELYRRPVSEWPAPHVDEGVQWQELLALPQPPRSAAGEPRAVLGRLLFFDPALSGSGQIACASCHDPEHAWTDGRRVPFGHNRTPGTRNTPSILNSGLMSVLFWDGRAPDLESQVVMPISDPTEMHHHPAGAEERIRALAEYPPLFDEAFGSPEVDYERITRAIAAFERTVVSRPSAFDAFVQGNETAMTDQQIRGLHWFRTEARCMNCHNGVMFSDQQFHNLGLHYAGRTYQDYGRWEVTGRDEDAGAFRTAPLRDVAFTAPYMHNGLFPRLLDVVRMYNGGAVRPRPREGVEYPMPFPQTDPLLKPLGLDAEQIDDIVAFLHAISSPPRRIDGELERRLRNRALGRPHEPRPAPGSPDFDAVPMRAAPSAIK